MAGEREQRVPLVASERLGSDTRVGQTEESRLWILRIDGNRILDNSGVSN